MKLKKWCLIAALVALTACGAACKGGEDDAQNSPPENPSYGQDGDENVGDDSSETKTEGVQALENQIAALPTLTELDLTDANAVAMAEAAFEALTEAEKATVENYDTLFSAIERIVFLNNVKSADVAIAALPTVNAVTIANFSQIEQAYALVTALSENERLALAEYDKLTGCYARMISIKKIARVNELIASLPTPDVIDEADLAQIEEVERAFADLTESEKLEVQNAGAINEARVAVTASYWKDTKLRKHYVAGRDITFKINLKQNTVKKLTADGETLTPSQYAYADGVLTIQEETLQTLSTGMHLFELTDSRDKSFRFIVGAGYAEKNTAYFDFDVVDYTSPETFGVPSTVEENGITGNSGRFTKSTEYANVFGFFKGGEYGFVDYTFKTGKVYLLEFDIKILDQTSDAWWMPIYFGGKGDVAYLYSDYTLKFPQVNTLYAEGGLEMRGDYAHVKAIFRATQETANLEFASWGGGLDILLDNILLTTLPEDNVNAVNAQIAALPDTVTEKDRQSVLSAKNACEALSLAEQQTVENVGKLADLIVQLSLIEEAASVVEMIDKLPEVGEMTTADYPAILAAKEAFDGLGETAQAYVTNSAKLTALLQSIGESYWNEAGVEFYLPAGENFSVKVELLDNGIDSITLNSKVLDASQYAYADGVLDFGALFVSKARDVYTLTLTDGDGKKFTFFVYLDIAKDSAVYYDFEYYTYENTDGAAVASTQYADGIQGASQRFTKDGGLGTIFGFFRGGAYGFVPYNFEAGNTYTLSFDIKVLEGTATSWWMPIYFSGGKGDLVYVRQNGEELYLQEYSVDALNAKNRQTITANGDGSYRVTVTFTLQAGETYDNIEFSNWDGAVDILLDNVLLIKE